MKGLNMTAQTAEQTKTEMTFEQAETLLAQLDEKSKSYRQQFEQIRDRAERIERDIAAAQKAGDECLNRYRDCLHNGAKQAADEYLDKVSKHRKLAEKLHAGLPELLKDAERLTQDIESTRKQAIELAETGILLSLKQRLENALGKSAGLLHDFSHVAGETAKLADLIKNQ
jgi:chromosome segregation ATPase